MVKSGLSAVSFSREEYDHFVRYSVQRQGRSFLESISAPINTEKLQRALMFLGAFIREASLGRETRAASEQTVLDHFLGTSQADGTDEWNGYNLDYIRTVLPVKIAEYNYAEVKKTRDEVDGLRDLLKNELRDVQERIAGHKEELRKLESEYNFVGLSHAFRSLFQQKKAEARWLLAFVGALGGFTVAVPAIIALASDSSPLQAALSKGWTPFSIAHLVGFLGIELLILYFFRVALRSYLVVRSQKTNLQLRLALCTFVDGYLDFAGKAAAAKGTAAMSGFESLIFSALPTDDGTLPATFEGLDQAVSVIAAATNKKPA